MPQLGPLRNRAEKLDSFTDSLGLLTEGRPEGVRVMEQEFQRADLEALMGGDALLDGQELSCGFVRIAAVGLLLDYRAKRGEEPLFNMNFNSGRPVLPFPFTLEQFKAFCVLHPAFKWEVIDLEFTNSFCPWNAASQGNASDALDWAADDDTILELERRNQASAVLVRSILGISQMPEVAESAFGTLQTDKAGPVNKAWVMKKAALIRKHAAQWEKIDGDFHSASENGLSKAAKAPGHGVWFEAAALNWADQRGKLAKEKEQGSANFATVWKGKKHTIEG